jgi:protocatechuate 4,5-dioxygenase beta chain
MFTPPELWPKVHQALVKDVPQPPEVAQETPEVIQAYYDRVQHGLATLRQQIEQARLDAIVIVGDDQREVFSDACVPAIATFLGEEAEGTTSIGWIGQKPDENRVTLKCHPELARALTADLIRSGFDPAYIEKLTPLAKPERGLGHAFVRLGLTLGIAELEVPAILVFLNAYHPPLPTAERCYQLGQTIRSFCDRRPERIGILGSGGLSHDPLGPRAGWVDETLDRWVLDRIETGQGHELKSLFGFESEMFHGGTGEIRSWIVVAGAMEGRAATVVDYVPARHAVTGLGMAYWNGS